MVYLIYGNIYHQYIYTPNVGIYTIHGSYGNRRFPSWWMTSSMMSPGEPCGVQPWLCCSRQQRWWTCPVWVETSMTKLPIWRVFHGKHVDFTMKKYGKMERQWPGCWNLVSIFLLKICSGGDFKEKKWRDQPYSLLWQKPWLINFTNQTSKQHRSRADLAKIAAGHPGAALQACEKSGQWQMALTLLEDTEVQLRSGSRKFHRPSSANIPFTCAEPWLLKIQTD